MMRDSEKSNDRKAVSSMSGVICFLSLTILYVGLLKHDLASERERYTYMTKIEAEHIVTTVDCVMARTNTLKALIQDHNGDTSFFNHVAEDIFTAVVEETGITLKNFAIAPNCIVSDVYPLEGNERLVGFNFLDTSHTGNLEAKEAYENGVTKLTNPFELIQGGFGMGARSPVILRRGEKSELWGLVTVTMDFNNLIDVLGLENLEGMGVNYALSYIDDDGKSHLLKSKGFLGGHPVKTQFAVRNLTWSLELYPSKGWGSVWRIVFFIVILLIISGFVSLFTNIMLQMRKTNTILLKVSNTDSLTGGLNRRAYEEALSNLSQSGPDENFIYVSADLNGLKHVNDTLGHLAGDELINGAMECLEKIFGPFGNIYRIGGDEFAALIKADEKTLETLMQKIEDETSRWQGREVKNLSLSIGQASHHEFPDATMTMLIKSADERMYDAKREYYKSKGVERRRF